MLNTLVLVKEKWGRKKIHSNWPHLSYYIRFGLKFFFLFLHLSWWIASLHAAGQCEDAWSNGGTKVMHHMESLDGLANGTCVCTVHPLEELVMWLVYGIEYLHRHGLKWHTLECTCCCSAASTVTSSVVWALSAWSGWVWRAWNPLSAISWHDFNIQWS